MKRFLFLITIFFITCNGTFAQSLGKMSLGMHRYDIPVSLPNGYKICKTNTDNHLTYTTSKGDEYVSFYLTNKIVHRIVMHKFVAYGSDANNITSKLEELIMNLYETWGEPSYIGENIYWQFSASKATFSYTVSTSQMNLDPLYGSGPTTFYKCYADIKLEKNTNLFE